LEIDMRLKTFLLIATMTVLVSNVALGQSASNGDVTVTGSVRVWNQYLLPVVGVIPYREPVVQVSTVIGYKRCAFEYWRSVGAGANPRGGDEIDYGVACTGGWRGWTIKGQFYHYDLPPLNRSRGGDVIQPAVVASKQPGMNGKKNLLPYGSLHFMSFVGTQRAKPGVVLSLGVADERRWKFLILNQDIAVRGNSRLLNFEANGLVVYQANLGIAVRNARFDVASFRAVVPFRSEPNRRPALAFGIGGSATFRF
jgi:hypothetical protein